MYGNIQTKYSSSLTSLFDVGIQGVAKKLLIITLILIYLLLNFAASKFLDPVDL